MPAQLRIMLLGSLSVSVDGRALPDTAWRSRQERRLLGMLLAARGARVSTERLIGGLWPDAQPDAAATTLRSTISVLRHTLEGGAARASSRYILTRSGGYAWNPQGGAWVDIDEFTALTDEPPAAQHPARIAEAGVHRLERALELYRGDFFADEPDAPWAGDLREALRERFLAALHKVAEHRRQAGALDAAIELARRGLERDRLREQLYRTMMAAQAQAGDIASALQTYERCRAALDDELGAAPSPQTRDLHAAILRGELAGQPARRRDTPAGRPANTEAESTNISTPRPTPTSASPFVGRAHELATLREWIAALDQRRGGVAAIVGQAGIGKTRLVAEALHDRAGGQLTIGLHCALLERERPFAALSEALRPLLRAAPLEALQRLPPVALAQVAALLPVLRERLPDLPALPPAPPSESRNYLLDGLVDVALALAREQPLIVWCDDAQWADEATLAVIGRLARRASRRALLIILAYRPEELVENAALHALLRALGREMWLRPLLLDRLADGEIAQLLAGQARASLGQVAGLAARLSASAGGNPLFVSLAVQALLESHGALSLAELLPALDRGTPPPDLASIPPLRDLVLSRVERLPEPARELLEQLAVIGRPASLDLIEQLAGAPALDAARQLLERQLLSEHDDGRLAFEHDLVRSIVAAALPSPRRRLLHRHAAEAIAELHGERPERAAELAFHFAGAGHGGEADVLRYALEAGDHARRAYGYHAALAHYTAAIRAAERLGARAPAEQARRAFAGRLLIAEALLDWDGIVETARSFERWAAGRPAQPPLVTRRRLALLRALMGDLAGAYSASAGDPPFGTPARQPDTAPALDDMLRRMALILEPAAAGSRGGDRETGRQGDGFPTFSIQFVPTQPPPGEPADDLPALLGPEDAALALFQIGWALLTQGLAGAAKPALRRAYDLAVETSQAGLAVASALQLAHLASLRGDQAATERWMDTSLATARLAPEAAWASIWPRIHQAFLLLLDDQHADARARFEQLAAELRDSSAFQSQRASVEVGLALIELAGGDYAAASQRLRRALAAPQSLYGFVYVAAQHALARISTLRGDLPAARALLTHALDYSASRSLLPEYARTAIEIARVERDFGDPAGVVPLLNRAAELAGAYELAPLAEAARALAERLKVA